MAPTDMPAALPSSKHEETNFVADSAEAQAVSIDTLSPVRCSM